MTEFRAPGEKDRAAIVALMKIAFNPARAWADELAPKMSLAGFLCSFDGPRLVAMARSYELSQWFGGRAVPMAGIAAVAASPEGRGAGRATELLRRLLRSERDRGAVISTLYPSRAAVYRRLGYEYSAMRLQYAAAISDLPAAPPPSRPAGPGVAIEVFGWDNLPDIVACYRRFAARTNGLVEMGTKEWWSQRVLREWAKDNARFVVARQGGEIRGYAAFTLETTEGWNFRLVCSHLVWETGEAARALLGYFRRFRGVGRGVAWWGAPNEPLGLLMETAADSFPPARVYRAMTRILDVRGALEARGYAWPAAAAGQATVAIEDDLFPENRGTFRIEAEGGRVRVTKSRPVNARSKSIGRKKVSATRPIPIGLFSAAYTGYLSADDLVRLGALAGDDPARVFLGALFAGPAPWLMDMF
jgi:predicted acetyltransferase